MENKQTWEQKAAAALNSLDGMERASANPYLYTRIMARLAEKPSIWSQAADFIAKPVVAFTLTAVFVGVNAWVVTQPKPEQKTAAKHLETEQAFDQDYATVNYSLGELNTSDK